MKELKIQMWPIEKVLPYEQNSKIHDKAQISKIAASIKEYGWDQPIVVDKDGVIIKGHGRRLAALSLEMTTVPVLVRSDLTPVQVRAARLADNRVALGGIDTAMMQQEIKAISAASVDLSSIFDKKELAFIDTDLGEINADVFVNNLDDEVRKQAEETEKSVAAADSREVPIAKALGFKFVSGQAERTISAFMATIEAQSGLKGADAFVNFIEQVTEG